MLHKFIKIKDSQNNGKGLFAINAINQGEVIWKLDPSEKILTKSERDVLPPEIRKLAFQYKDGFIVVHDGGQFMNHSCDPNTWWTSNDELSASRDIKQGEEISYDYSTADVGDWVAGWECKCGASICRHEVTGNDCLNIDFQKRYQGNLPSWTKEYIESHQN
jgi:hypothetical protein